MNILNFEKYNEFYSLQNKLCYNPIKNCKSAGVIPYTIHNGKVLLLLHKLIDPIKKKDYGWNDFGGKRNFNENTIITAAREFSEETSCLFYLQELDDMKLYDSLKNNDKLIYSKNDIRNLKSIIPLSTKYFSEKINKYVSPIYINSKEIYISYLVKVNYLDVDDIPKAEDIHIPYENRYIRKCKWFTIDDLVKMDDNKFHKRLQITKIKERIHKFYNNDLLS